MLKEVLWSQKIKTKKKTQEENPSMLVQIEYSLKNLLFCQIPNNCEF